ncbi:sulfite exporter TauE/SafE family protein [Nocardioides acrostichi]|uniref:sulfite exporter TauE/SafE family protein n=1 Tax=Nocardioides acrostichi TaxID=2784339 RepID=UPI002E2A1A82|nr:sulfite exporter TauE/SafE family protein [Nocardioides acrostichi]
MLLTVALALLAGATVQSLVGLGLGLVAAPIVTLADPRLMPELLLLLAAVLPIVTLASEREDIDWFGLRWSLPTRVPGTAVGVWAVAVVAPATLGVLVALMVLAAVALTARAVRLPVTRTTLALAGLASGAAGTTTSIGGPPMAILYQHEAARRIRTTLAVYFMIGAALSLVGLLLAGELDGPTSLLALVMLPVLLLGAWLGRRLRPVLPEHRVRVAVLVVCASSALVLLVRSVV